MQQSEEDGFPPVGQVSIYVSNTRGTRASSRSSHSRCAQESTRDKRVEAFEREMRHLHAVCGTARLTTAGFRGPGPNTLFMWDVLHAAGRAQVCSRENRVCVGCVCLHTHVCGVFCAAAAIGTFVGA